jgi:hypothetical protein
MPAAELSAFMAARIQIINEDGATPKVAQD